LAKKKEDSRAIKVAVGKGKVQGWHDGVIPGGRVLFPRGAGVNQSDKVLSLGGKIEKKNEPTE